MTDRAAGIVDEETASRLRLAVMRLARRLRQQSPPGITPSQLSALGYLTGIGPLSIRALASYENVQSQTMSRIVDALEVGGWVKRAADRSDGRVVLVRATKKAEREMARLRSERNAFLTQRLATLDSDQLASLLAALPALECLLHEDDEPAGARTSASGVPAVDRHRRAGDER